MNFKYERLPNFCYGCGLLNHAIKDCPEGWVEKSMLEEGNMQYGAWLRGEPWRRNGWDTTQVGSGRRSIACQKSARDVLKKQTELTSMADTGDGSGGGHVPSLSIVEHNASMGEIPRSEELRSVGGGLHEFGKVNGVIGNLEEKVAQLGETTSGLQGSQAEKGAEMQWEVSETQKGEPKFEFKQAPNSLPTVSEAKEGDPKPNKQTLEKAGEGN